MLQPLIQAVAILLSLIFVCPVHAAEVVLLHSENRSTPWTEALADGLASGLGKNLLIKQEYLGGESVNEDHFDAEFERLASVYAATAPVAVVTSGKAAFAFMRKYREDLFFGAPILFCSMPRPGPRELGQCGDCTGVPLELDVRAAVDLIFSLRPDTRMVVGIMDTTPASQILRQKTETAMKPYMDRAQLLFPGHEPGDDAGLDMDSLASVASSIPSTAAVLFLGFNEDRTGKPVDAEQVVRLFAERGAGPVVVLVDTWIGRGVLGGLVAPGESHGRAGALLGWRRLSGESLQETRPAPTRPQLVADATVLARFGIDADMNQLSKARLVNAFERPRESGSIISTSFLSIIFGLFGFAGALYALRWFTVRRSNRSQ
jgi:hypothetical protein